MENTEEDKYYKIFEEVEKKGKENILKYFDRIHDKLFTLNTILIGAYYYFSKVDTQIPVLYITLPLLNLGYLIYIEYYNMETSRIEAEITKINLSKIDEKLYKRYSKITKMSLRTIISTSMIFIILFYKILL